jgi:arabinofuranosyltransferase
LHCAPVVPPAVLPRHGFLRWLGLVQGEGDHPSDDPSDHPSTSGRGRLAPNESSSHGAGSTRLDTVRQGVAAPRLILVLVLATVVGFVLHASAWTFTCDDAFISFRYASNFAATGELVYNVAPVERVEGYTNFLWVVLLAGFAKVGIAPHQIAPWLTPLSSCVGLVFAVLTARTLRRRWVDGTPQRHGVLASAWHPLDLLPATLLAAMPEWMVWSGSGLEAGATGALFLATVWAWERERLELAGLLAACLGLLRLDALVSVAGYGVGWLLLHGTTWWSSPANQRPALPWRRLSLAALCFVVPLVMHLVFRLAYYGAPLPHTWTVKSSGVTLRGRWGSAYVQQWAAWHRLPWLAPLAPLLRARQLPWIVAAACNLLWAWSVGGDFMAWSRFLVPATACLAMLLGGLCVELEGLAMRRGRSHVGVVLGLLLATGSAGLVPSRLQYDAERTWIHGIHDTRYESVSSMDRFAAERFAAGGWLRTHVDPKTRVSVGAAGALAYGAGVYVIDAYGLVDAELAKVAPVHEQARPGHQRYARLSQVLARDPDLLCHIGEVTDELPDDRLAARRVGPGWTWACLPTGPFTTREGEQPSTNYCCLRRRNHPVPPFGGEARSDDGERRASPDGSTRAP